MRGLAAAALGGIAVLAAGVAIAAAAVAAELVLRRRQDRELAAGLRDLA